MIYGIPNFKLEKYVVERRTKLLKESGIEFVQNFEVGKDATLDQLRKKHDGSTYRQGNYTFSKGIAESTSASKPNENQRRTD